MRSGSQNNKSESSGSSHCLGLNREVTLYLEDANYDSLSHFMHRDGRTLMILNVKPCFVGKDMKLVDCGFSVPCDDRKCGVQCVYGLEPRFQLKLILTLQFFKH